ncbi:UNKNOWN [Stylonychia lemnae]|uniref:Uncharacterized protein n=1 Tax=Stylonychia lemnae TaxID=5949 RepID=A0A078AZ34_STYLE|nr:UNKNOWN [Stylonychia lemnae]|eukprot:CDW87394.1 UNKNOWN [Stylonychia lemnae]
MMMISENTINYLSPNKTMPNSQLRPSSRNQTAPDITKFQNSKIALKGRRSIINYNSNQMKEGSQSYLRKASATLNQTMGTETVMTQLTSDGSTSYSRPTTANLWRKVDSRNSNYASTTKQQFITQGATQKNQTKRIQLSPRNTRENNHSALKQNDNSFQLNRLNITDISDIANKSFNSANKPRPQTAANIDKMQVPYQKINFKFRPQTNTQIQQAYDSQPQLSLSNQHRYRQIKPRNKSLSKMNSTFNTKSSTRNNLLDITEFGIEYSQNIFNPQFKDQLLKQQQQQANKIRQQSTSGQRSRQLQSAKRPISTLVSSKPSRQNNFMMSDAGYADQNPYSHTTTTVKKVIKQNIPLKQNEKENILSEKMGQKLSNLTEIENQNLQDEITKLRTIEDMLMETMIGGNNKSNANECQDLLQKTDKSIKLMQYKLSKMVCGGINQTLLSQNAPVNLDLIESTPIYCRVYTFQREAPLRINIEFRDKIEGDFKLYISDTSNEPNESNSTYYFHNQTKILVDPKRTTAPTSHSEALQKAKNKDNSRRFQCNYLFLNFTSLRGCSIKVHTKFPREDDDYDSRKKHKSNGGSQVRKMQYLIREEVQNRIRDIQDNPHALDEIKEIISKMKKDRRERLFGICNTNFMIQNTTIIENWESYINSQNKKRSLSIERIKVYQKKRHVMDIKKLHERIQRMNKWEMIREQRKFDAQDREKLLIRQEKNKKWINYLNLTYIIHSMFDNFRTKRAEVMLEQLRQRSARRIQNWYKINFKSIGLTYEVRLARKVAMQYIKNLQYYVFRAMSLIGYVRNEKVEDNAHDTIFKFLTNKSEVHVLKMKFIQFYKTGKNMSHSNLIVQKIQNSWKERMILLRYKIDFLIYIWDREKSIMNKHYYLKSKKNKKAKNIYNKLTQIDNSIRDSLIKEYFEKCRLEFTVQFFESKLDQNPKFVQEITNRLDAMRAQIKIKEEKIFHGVKMDEPLIDYEEPSIIHNKEQQISGLNSSKDAKKGKKTGQGLINKKDLQSEKHQKQGSFSKKPNLKGNQVSVQPEFSKFKKHSSILHKEPHFNQIVDIHQAVLFLKYIPRRIQMQRMIRRAMNSQNLDL